NKIPRRLQESPGSVPPGRLPRAKDVILLEDLVDSCKPGDEVELTAIYTHSYESSLNSAHGFPVSPLCSTRITCLRRRTRWPRGKLSLKRTSVLLTAWLRMARMAAAPYREARSRRASTATRTSSGPLPCVRRTPARPKSQFLQILRRHRARCVYATGQGASSVGLTAYVHKHPPSLRNGRHRHLAAGRCTVIAAANPIGGRYDPSMTFAENVDLTEPICRFDVLCVVRDQVDPVQDEKLARFVVGSHMRHHPCLSEGERQQLADSLAADRNLFYRRFKPGAAATGPVEKVHHLNQMDQEKVSKVYVHLRKESMATGSIPITVRHIESVIRLAEAHAKMHLRKYVDDSDVNMACTTRRSTLVMKTMERSFRRYLVQQDSGDLLVFLLRQLIHKHAAYSRTSRRAHDDDAEGPLTVRIAEKELADLARPLGITDLDGFFRSEIMTANRFRYDADRREIVCQAILVQSIVTSSLPVWSSAGYLELRSRPINVMQVMSPVLRQLPSAEPAISVSPRAFSSFLVIQFGVRPLPQPLSASFTAAAASARLNSPTNCSWASMGTASPSCSDCGCDGHPVEPARNPASSLTATSYTYFQLTVNLATAGFLLQRLDGANGSSLAEANSLTAADWLELST
uniref:DNA replication licensing factor MCM2 n=1 Tax=Macrostomum lignano TaxID=282301 RepID=A0A1I8FB31_9PLAT